MQNKIKKYLVLICAMGGIVLHGIGWSEMHEARALPAISGTESVQVQVTSSENTITLDYSIPGATLTSLDEESPCPKGTCTKTRVRAGNASQKDREGEPVIPVIPSIIIIPAGKVIDNINVTRTGEFEHEGEYFLEYGEKARVISDTTPFEPAVPDDSIYYSDNPFPGITHEIVTLQKKCGVSIAYINIFPVTYYPLSGRVISYSSISLNVNLKEAGTQSVYDIACYPERVNPERKGIENPDALESYTPAYCQQVRDGLPTGGICDPAETYEYVVITTDTLKNATPPFDLPYLLNHRILNSGLTATVVTTDGTDGIYNNYIGSEVPDDQIDKIRSFIRDAFNNWDTKYVLIIGDPNDNSDANCIVPMRRLYGHIITAQGEFTDSIYSDVYLQCLNDPYNSDGDEFWGERNDGLSGEDVDLTPEVFIGRVYAENETEMSNFIYKTYEYENSVFVNDDPYINEALMLGEYLSTLPNGTRVYATPHLERIRQGASVPKTYGFTSSPYYSITETWYDPEVYWDRFDVTDKLESNTPGIINHLGHGNYNRLMRCSTGDVIQYKNEKYPFLYSLGCMAGAPQHQSIGEMLTTGYTPYTRINGVWGAVLNTHYGVCNINFSGDVTGASPDFNIKFWNAYFYKGLLNLGAINATSHEDNLSNIDNESFRWVYFCNNTFGDPFTPFKDPILCERNIALWTFLGKEDVLARKLITTGEDVFITSLPGTEITFMSGKEIRLGPGLHISNGAEFKAFIDPTLYKSDCD